MKAIVAVDLNWGIGFKGSLLARIPEDMRFFKETTWGKVVVMGRETFDSLPKKEPLEGRVNIVLTTRKDYAREGVIVCHSVGELLTETEKYNPEDVFVIGGALVYAQLLPYCTEVYVTKIEKEYTADKYFPNLDQDGSWDVVYLSETKVHHETRFRFAKYLRKK